MHHLYYKMHHLYYTMHHFTIKCIIFTTKCIIFPPHRHPNRRIAPRLARPETQRNRRPSRGRRAPNRTCNQREIYQSPACIYTADSTHTYSKRFSPTDSTYGTFDRIHHFNAEFIFFSMQTIIICNARFVISITKQHLRELQTLDRVLHLLTPLLFAPI